MSDLPKGLPGAVAKRLDDLRGVCVRSRSEMVEVRLSADLEVRMVGDNRAAVHGYATVYDFPYDVAGGPPFGFTETFARGATKRSIKNGADVRFLVNHGGIPLARTRSGTMTLASDDTGLLVDAPSLDLRSTASRDAVLAMERGDLDEMSVAFQVLDQEWNADYTERLIREVKLFDVSLVTYPANPAASAYLRESEPSARGMSLSLALAQADALKLSR